VTLPGQPTETVPDRWTHATVYSDMWADPDDDPRERVAAGTDERAVLLDYLRRYRLTLEMKCAGLDAGQLARRSVPPSTMSLLGLVRHLADVERGWFRREMAGQEAPPLFYTKADSDGDWTGAVPDPAVVDEAWRACRDEVAFVEELVAGHRRPRRCRPERAVAARRARTRDRGVRAALWACRPAARAHRRPGRPVAAPAVKELAARAAALLLADAAGFALAAVVVLTIRQAPVRFGPDGRR
jgi:hypothetical protein